MKKYFILFCFILGNHFCASANQLNVYTWSEYLPEHIVEKFTKETGVKLNLSTYDSNESLYTKIKLLHNSQSGYDLVMPSTYFVSKMREEGLLMELDISKITNFKDIDKSLVNQPFDLDNKYSIPYFWGSTALCYNDKYVKENVDSFNILFDPKYAHKTLLTDDVREVFHVALKLLGYSVNDTNEEHIKQAYEKLKTLVPNVKIFNSFSPKLNYINEEVILGMNHNGEAYMASLENPDIKYVYPKEGAIIWVDSLVMPSNVKNVENAYKFINFLLKPEIAKEISEVVGFATVSKVAMDLLPKEIRNNPTIYPSKEILDKGEFQNDVGEAIVIYEKYWEILKLGQ